MAYEQNDIQTQHDVAQIYEDSGKHFITIVETRLLWLMETISLSP
jgi:hypothetical protein